MKKGSRRGREQCGFCPQKIQRSIEKSSGGKILERADQRVFSMFSFLPRKKVSSEFVLKGCF